MMKPEKLKKIIISFVVLIVTFLGIYFIGSGLMRMPSVYIDDYALSADGTEMTVRVSVTASVGYVRKIAVHQQQGGRLYLDCYAGFGGINGSIGARSEYTIPLAADTEVIALYRNNNCYAEVLKKAEDGSWQRVIG